MTDSFSVDPGALTRVGERLITDGDDLDALGNGTPSGDYGMAGPLIEWMISRFCTTGADLVVEAKIIGETVVECADTSSLTDQDAAESFLITGPES